MAEFLSNLAFENEITDSLVNGAAEMQRGIGETALLPDHSEYVNSSDSLELSQPETRRC